MSSNGKALLLVLLLASVPAYADEPTPAWAKKAQPIADWLSTGAVIGAIANDTWHSFKADDRTRAFVHQALREGVTIAVSEGLKRLIHRTRPDGSDRMSFPSEHTALPFASAVYRKGWALNASVGFELGTGYGRVAANKHHISDVLAGAGIGALVGRLFR